MEMSLSKQRILDEALKLFSINGYEATSISQIADAVGIRKSSLYSHFKSKQEILDTVIEEVTIFYEEHSLFAKVDWTKIDVVHKDYIVYTEDDVFRIVKEQLMSIIHNPYVSMIRKLLTIEQFRNPQLEAFQNRVVYTDVLNFHKGLIQYLIDEGVFIDGDVEIMAFEFFSPVSIQLYRIQREPECEDDAMRIVEKHIRHICKMYCKK